MTLGSHDSEPSRAPIAPLPAAARVRFDHGSRRREIVQSLLADIIHGRLATGERLVTQQLAERFGVSHTPVREALVALSGLGLVDLEPNRGAVVHRLTAREIQEIYQVRRVLEREAVRSACGRIDLEALARLSADLRRLRASSRGSDVRFIERARELDSELHDLIARSCGNSFLESELDRLKHLFRAFRDLAWNHEEARRDARRLAGEAREHLAIVEALRKGDRKGAARAMSLHIRSGALYWKTVLPAGAPRAAPARRTTRSGAPQGSAPRREALS